MDVIKVLILVIMISTNVDSVPHRDRRAVFDLIPMKVNLIDQTFKEAPVRVHQRHVRGKLRKLFRKWLLEEKKKKS